MKEIDDEIKMEIQENINGDETVESDKGRMKRRHGNELGCGPERKVAVYDEEAV